MNRAKIQDYIGLREEQRADLFHFEKQGEDTFLLNGHQYKVLVNYRDGFDGEELAKRFSGILNKYDYIVGDWGYGQLRLKGFYSPDNPSYTPSAAFNTIEDYLYEDCNFGCAYFVVQNYEVQVPKKHSRRRKKRRTPFIKEKRKKVSQAPVRERKKQTVSSVKQGKEKRKFVMRKRVKEDANG